MPRNLTRGSSKASGISLRTRFLGEHGMCRRKRGSLEETFSCTCPFFSELGTCSTVALALKRSSNGELSAGDSF